MEQEHHITFGPFRLEVAHIRQGLAASLGVGPEVVRPDFLSLLAEAYGQVGQPEAGLTVLSEALTLVATTEERWWEAELYRLKGVLLLAQAGTQVDTTHTWEEAEACLHQALDHSPWPAGQGVGAACCAAPESVVATARQAEQRSTVADRYLSLVHRRL